MMIALFDSSRLNIGDLLYDESPVCTLEVGYLLQRRKLKMGLLPTGGDEMKPAVLYYIEIAGGFT